jgi:4-carboxymuconolactone decarboxylase
MRLEAIEPQQLTAAQKPLYRDMKEGIEAIFKGFKAIRKDGALLGPWNPWINFPHLGKPTWELAKTLAVNPKLSQPVREIAILVTGTHFHAGYELYSHVLIAELRGLKDDTLGTVVAGQRPSDLDEDQSTAYDVASSLTRGGVLPKVVYDKAVRRFGREGTAELIYLVGLYSMIAVTLNGFNVPIPEQDE